MIHCGSPSFGEKERQRNLYYSIPMGATTTTTWLATRTSAFTSSSSRGVGTLGRRARRHASASTPKGVNAVRSNASLGRSACPERGRCAPREDGRRRDAHQSTASFSGRREDKIIVAQKVVVHKRAHRKGINGGWATRSSIGNYDDDDEKKTTERDGDGKNAANESPAENNNATNSKEVFDKALSKKLTTMPIPSAERKRNIVLRTLTAVAITCAAIIPQISERPPMPAVSAGTARTSTLVVGATKSVLDDAGLKKEKDRKRSSWYAGTINL